MSVSWLRVQARLASDEAKFKSVTAQKLRNFRLYNRLQIRLLTLTGQY
jgi:hypothetical protein